MLSGYVELNVLMYNIVYCNYIIFVKNKVKTIKLKTCITHKRKKKYLGENRFEFFIKFILNRFSKIYLNIFSTSLNIKIL